MHKFTVLLLLCFSILSCQNNPNDSSKEVNAAQGSSISLSHPENKAIRSKFDSLLSVVIHLRDLKQDDNTVNYLHESLSLAQQLNNDSLVAKVYISLAGYFDDVAEYYLEVDCLYKAFETYQKQQNYNGITIVLNNMAWAYIQAYDYKKGIDQALRGLEYAKYISKEESRSHMISFLCNNLSIAYLECNMPDSALTFNEKSYAAFPDVREKKLNHYGWIFAQFGSIYSIKKEYSEAEKCFSKVLEVKDSPVVADAVVYGISRYCHLLNEVKQYERAISTGREGLIIARNSGLKRYLIAIADELSYANEKLHKIDSAFTYAKMATDLRESVFNTKKSIQLQNMSFGRELKEQELNYEIDKAKTQEKLISAQRLRNIFLMGLVLVMLFAGLFLHQRNKIKAGKIRSDELLLNILPLEVAEELKSKGSTQAKQFDNVTVMFTDFKNFTKIAEKLSPQELVSEIHICFKAFDEIIEKYNIEKIKTIGDSYMCVGGLPVSNSTHAFDVVSAALEIQEFIRNHSQQKQAQGKELFEIRIGIHTGPVVAGIVGIKKFAYDIWGDTVNIASRMESSGEVGKVNISETTYGLVKARFNCTFRGKIQVKNKGELDMYFVECSI